MQGIDFDFNKENYKLDSEDLIAQNVCGEKFFENKDLEFTLDNDLTYEECFEAGFIRGIVWILNKNL